MSRSPVPSFLASMPGPLDWTDLADMLRLLPFRLLVAWIPLSPPEMDPVAVMKMDPPVFWA